MRLMQVRDSVKCELAEKMRQRSDALSAGRATDFADYKQTVGRIQGLRDAMDVVDAVFNRLNDSEE